jgi:hypothetical protein
MHGSQSYEQAERAKLSQLRGGLSDNYSGVFDGVTRRLLVDFVTRLPPGAKWLISLGDIHYTPKNRAGQPRLDAHGNERRSHGPRQWAISDNTRQRAIDLFEGTVVDEGHGSDTDLYRIIRASGSFKLHRFQPKPPPGFRPMHEGSFFRWTLRAGLGDDFYDLFKRLQIFPSVLPKQEACIYFALKQAGVPKQRLHEVASLLISPKIPMKRLRLVADAAGVYLELCRRGKGKAKKTAYTRYGDPEKPKVELCLSNDHYFVNTRIEVCSYALKHVAELKDKPRWWEISGPRNKRAPNSRNLKSLTCVELLLEHRTELLDAVEMSEELLRSIHFTASEADFTDRVVPIHDDCSYVNQERFDPMVKLHQRHARTLMPTLVQVDAKKEGDPPTTKKQYPDFASWEQVFTSPKEYVRVAFDVETSTDGERHKEYLWCIHDDRGVRMRFLSPEPGGEMLAWMRNHYEELGVRKLLLLAHNAGYDWRQLMPYLPHFNLVENGNSMVFATAALGSIEVVVHNTLRLIPKPLKEFGKMFKLDVKKEMMPYTLYSERNVAQRYIEADECTHSYVKPADRAQYIHNVEEWGCLGADGRIDIIEYSARYCELDCEVLLKGYLSFREMVYEITNLDIDAMFTLPSIADAHLTTSGCYDGVEILQGVLREYTQRPVVGGRVMIAENKPCATTCKMVDIDGVSLYPSAMVRMEGFPKGKAKNFTILEMDASASLSIEQVEGREGIFMYDAFYCRIRVLAVGRSYKIPLLSRVDKDGGRLWTNDMAGHCIHVDKISLEDMIRFHRIEYDVINGVYFNDGFNSRVNDVMQGLFNKRKLYKDQGNPIEQVFKLLMASSYGKTLLKPQSVQSVYVSNRPRELKKKRQYEVVPFEDRHAAKARGMRWDPVKASWYKPVFKSSDWDRHLIRHFESIHEIDVVQGGNMVHVRQAFPIQSHSNRVHCGVAVLSMSKRIMQELTALVEDVGDYVRYTDTDSTHIPQAVMPQLEDAFREKYGRELVGDELQQFNNDFKIDGCKNVHATESAFLFKKGYCDCLVGTRADGSEQTAFHFRLKGVKEKSVLYEVEQQKCDVMDLYRRMLPAPLGGGETIEFNLLATPSGEQPGCSFVHHPDGTVSSRDDFTRQISVKAPPDDGDDDDGGGEVGDENAASDAVNARLFRDGGIGREMLAGEEAVIAVADMMACDAERKNSAA